MVIVISHKIYFKTAITTRDKKKHFIMLKRSGRLNNHNEYAPNKSFKIAEVKFAKLKGEKDNSIIIVRDINTSLSVINKSGR